MTILDLIRGRRSIRAFRGDPLPADAVDALVEALRWAPSTGNLQSRRFLLVRDAGRRARLAGAALRQANVMKRRGFTFSRGFECTVHGEIPINSGTSSSTALTVTWVNFLGRASDQNVALSPDECARIGHAAEVLEFGEPGGMMDHFSTAFGGTIFIRFHPDIVVTPLRAELGTFVLGDSGEPKDTKGILSRVKDQVLHSVAILGGKYSDFSLQTVEARDLDRYAGELTQEQRELLRGTIRNRMSEVTFAIRSYAASRRIDHCSSERSMWGAVACRVAVDCVLSSVMRRPCR